jgi:hypothetical protein
LCFRTLARGVLYNGTMVNRWWCLLVLTVVSGCYPVIELQRPRVVKPGDVRVAVGTRWQTVGPYGGPGIPHLPVAEMSLRIGVASDIDVGLRYTTAALEAGPKVMLHDTSDAAVAIAPALTLAGDADGVPTFGGPPVRGAMVAMLRLPVFLSIRVGEHMEPWIAPSLHTGTYVDERFGALLAFGCVAGVDLILSRSTTVQPQVGALVTVAGPGPVDGEDRRLTRGDYRFTAALNVFLGR